MKNQVIMVGDSQGLSAFNQKINNALSNIAKVGKLVDIKYCVDNGYHTAMIIYEVCDV